MLLTTSPVLSLSGIGYMSHHSYISVTCVIISTLIFLKISANANAAIFGYFQETTETQLVVSKYLLTTSTVGLLLLAIQSLW